MRASIKKRSQRQEKEFSKRRGGRTRPGSGSTPFYKGDSKLDKFLVELKYTDKDEFRVHADTWNKIRHEALREGLREPMMQIEIQDLRLVLVDANCEYFQNRDPSFGIKGIVRNGGKTVNIKKKDWDFLSNIKFPDFAAIALGCSTVCEDTGEHLNFALVMMKEDDFFRLIGEE